MNIMKEGLLWGGRFIFSNNEKFKVFNQSLKVDYRLVEYDILSSIAWCKALKSAGILNKQEKIILEGALKEILKEVKQDITIVKDSKEEDVHSWVEVQIINKVGLLGKKLNTGRSRNDQITTDLKLWCKYVIQKIFNSIKNFQETLLLTAEKNQDVIMPGYTHLQKAQPILFSHWCLAYYEMFSRDNKRLSNTLYQLDVSPLGSGALAGIIYPIDRYQLAKYLGFSSITNNSLDSVSDRDYVLELLSNAAISMIHLSRFSEDLIFFNTSEAGFIELSDTISSGSSLLPQKKNPDALELIRAKCARIQGELFGIMTIMKGLPLSYNKDMQEDKEGLFYGIDTWIECLDMASIILDNIKIKKFCCKTAAMQNYGNALQLVDYLVMKGIYFRDAHKIVGEIILFAMDINCALEQLTIDQFKKFSVLIDDNVYEFLSLEKYFSQNKTIGSVSFNNIKQSIQKAKKDIISSI